ncbi:hypothetical protein MMC13_002702 [Lambiella insularis]|nr:hypothetical protein [Lambiella insularis]
MFSRRRAQSNPPLKTPPTAAAATAAAQAFLANRASNANLSSAAAAAALRTHARTPTPVGEIQTKRMLQRQASVSSNGSASGALGRPTGMLRRNSSGSMTERTFREPSPSRRSQARTMDDEAPPLPPLPAQHQKGYVVPPPLPVRSTKRPASVEPPQRISSPPPKLPGGRGVSLDRGPGPLKGKPNKVNGQRIYSLGNVQEIERPSSRNSVNFSRPMGAQNSPPTSPLREGQPLLATGRHNLTQQAQGGNSALTEGEVKNIQHLLRETAGSPVTRKKKKIVPAMVEGSHLANGTSGAKPTGASLEGPSQRQDPSALFTSSQGPNTSSNQSQDNNVIPIKMKKKRNSTEPVGSVLDYGSDSDAASELSYSSDRPRNFNTRAAGILTKQPSIVREEREAEEEEERVASPVQERASQNDTASLPATKSRTTRKPKQTIDTQITGKPGHLPVTSPTSSSTLEPVRAPQQNPDPSRRSSLSPARAAHFSSQPVLESPEGLRHQPSSRSVSPAKSALKHSPSPRGPSPVGIMPGGWNRPGQAPSEASDTTSMVSEDGPKAPSRKKKNVRVSFDDDPTVVGRASTPPTNLDSPVIFSPQSKDHAKRGWFGLGGDKKKEPVPSENENEDAIKPVPALPSFGSVRSRKEPVDESGAKDIQGRAHAETSSQNAPYLRNSEASGDLAIGEVISRDFNQKNKRTANHNAGNPLPPEVTSVEGTGYNSDTEGSTYSNEGIGDGGPSRPADDSSHYNDDVVPKISIQPATPGIDESSQRRDEWLGMPGGFPASIEIPEKQASRLEAEADRQYIDKTPSSIGIAEPEPESTAAYHDPVSPVVGGVADSLRQQTTLHEEDVSDDTGASIYSDAAEDVSDPEGDGFGSINAIVGSPTRPTFDTLLQNSPSVTSKEKSAEKSQQEEPEPASGEGWDKTQAYWSGLSQSRKSQIEEAASSQIVAQEASRATAKTTRKKKVVPKNTAGQSTAQLPIPETQNLDSERQTTTSPMAKTLRNRLPETTETPHFRSSMRDATTQNRPPRPNSSVKPAAPKGVPEPKGTLQKKARPVSAVAMVDYSKPASAITQNRMSAGGPAPKSLTPVKAQTAQKSTSIVPASRRTMSNGSDSSSSFKKARPVSSETGRYTMKRSMRSSSVDERSVPAANRSSRFSLRSASPTGSTTRASFSPPSMGMRTSMRDSADLSKARSSKSPSGSFGFGKSSKPKSTSTKPASRFSSRFGDSSDEEDGPMSYRSRFVDSSDEDEPKKYSSRMTPVRGIPKRIDEGESTDLEDSTDEAVPGEKQGPASPQSIKALEGSALASGSLRTNGTGGVVPPATNMGGGLQAKMAAEKDKKKRSFFGSLGKRRDDAVVKADGGSAARRDMPSERSKPERILGSDAPAPSPKSPKLQRRNTPKRYASDSWPLPENQNSAMLKNRPQTSDGNTASVRPELGTRRSTAQIASANGAALGKNGKKKRFPMLRKAFGLHD